MSEKLGRLNRLKINGYKSIKSLDIELQALNILIGANGVGKSNFIGFFKFMKKILDKDLQFYVAQQGGANKILHFGSKTTEELSFKLFFPPNAYNCELVSDFSDSFIFKKEIASCDNSIYRETKHILAKDGDIESKLPTELRYSIEGYVVRYLNDWKVYHFHDTSITSKVKQTCNINDANLSPDAQNLSAFLYAIKLNSPKSYKKIVKTIQRVAPFFHDFILEPEIHNSDTIRLKWKHQGTDEYFDANDLSDGTLRFICLTTLLLQPNLPTIILLDEPELGLHPFALKLLASIFRVVAKKTQIIASTQSVTLADEFDIEDIIVVDRVQNHSEFKRLDREKYKEWLEDYSLGEIWQKNLIGGVPSYMIRVAISVEGQSEDVFCKTILNPYFRNLNIELTPIIITTKREECGIKHKGGCISLARVYSELQKLLPSFDYVTTFYDLYGFQGVPLGISADDLEMEIRNNFKHDYKLIPYIQKYEFETLLFSDPSFYEEYFDDGKAKILVEKIINSCGGNVENINNSRETAPSKRLMKLFDTFDENYDKVFHGEAIIEEIGLEKVMQECSRFSSWVEKIKSLSN